MNKHFSTPLPKVCRYAITNFRSFRILLAGVLLVFAVQTALFAQCQTAAITATQQNVTITSNSTTGGVSNLKINASTNDSYQTSDGKNKPTNYESGEIRFKGFRFPDLNIPAGAIITSAQLRLVGYKYGSVQVAVKAENLNAPPAYTNANNYLSSRSVTAASANWSIPSLTNGTQLTSPDLSAVVQQVVNAQNGITHLSLILSNPSGKWETWNFDDGASNSSKFPILNLTYTVTTTNSNGSICKSQPVTFSSQSNGCAYYNWNFGAGATPQTATGIGPHSVTYSSGTSATVSCSVGSNASTSVTFNLNTCDCSTLNGVPALISTVATNYCPVNTVNLNALVPIYTPTGYALSWHTGIPATNANKVANPGAVAEGIYYAAFYNSSFNCYGNKTTKVTATVGACNSYTRDKNRSLDGSMNNLSNSNAINYGKAGNAFTRELPAAYADGISALAGPNRPNPRALSNKLSQELEDDHNDREMAGLFYIWGQFIDHDMTGNSTNPNDPANISLPSNESIFSSPITFRRSNAHPGTGVNTPREQTNRSTAWLDGSQVYGITSSHAAWLRTFSKGKMKTSKGDLLPFNTLTGEFDSPIDPSAPSMDDDQGGTKKTFVAGDRRVAEHPGLTSLHTLFVREHNRICDQLVGQGMSNDEEIYQRARKIIGALIQHITYTQWMEGMGIQLNNYTGYKPDVHPDILNSFSAAAYRWHTMVENDIILRDNECNGVGEVEFPLRDVFFNIGIIRKYDIGVILKGLSVHRQYETDLKVNGGLRNFLAGTFGSDLVSINIQRGRDHGLPSYNDFREYYTGTRAYSFMDIAGVDSTAQKLASIYNSPNDVDLWVGLYAEKRLPGKSIGMTVNALISAQFSKLRDGDYYFYKNDPELSSLSSYFNSTNLDDIISRNSTAGNFQDNVFFRKFCSPEGDDLAKTPCSVVSEFEGWTYLGSSSSSKYYKWNGGDMNYDDANEQVQSLAAHLPQLSDGPEKDKLKTFISGSNAWLDMVRVGTGSNSSSWRFSPVFNNDDILVQGSNVSYFNWASGEPNNWGGNESRVEIGSDGKWNDIAPSHLKMVIAEQECDQVTPACIAGNSAPALTSYIRYNECPTTTINLSTVTASNKPQGTIITWHTGTPATNNNRITNISALSPGTYYAAFYSQSANCYSGSSGSKTTAYIAALKACDCSVQGGDTDGDGICNNLDCQPNNPAFPATPGTACNDGNPNTTNDVVQSNGCSCVGTPPIPCVIGTKRQVTNNILCVDNTTPYTFTFSNQFWTAGNDLVFSEFPNGTATLTGTIKLGASTLNVNVNFSGKTTTAPANSPKYQLCVNSGGASWYYYTTFSGTVGSMNITTFGPAFQVGLGANLNEPNQFGGSGWFSSNGGATMTGDFNFRLGTPTNILAPDSDNDGVCDALDCQPNNLAFPATPGSACNDGNANTANDVVTADGCGCAGTPIDPCTANNFSIDCEKNVNNAGWSIVPDCTVSVCPGEKVFLSVNPNGYPTSWTGPNGFIANTNDILVANSVALANAGSYTATVNVNGCIKSKTITLQVRDTDGDGICNENDCQPNNPAFPATPGTACNDGNPNTTNDVVQANGCACAGTPANPCANLGGDSDGDGVCNNNDCQPNNPAFPATPGTACNDGNPNTTNDVVQADGCSCAGTPVSTNVDLELTKSVNATTVTTGQMVMWTISVVNKGPANATGVTVKDALPAGLTYNSANATQGSFNAGTLTWDIGNLAVNQTVALTINTTVTATSGTIRNFAQVQTASPNDIDSTPGNDTNQTVNEDDEDDATINVGVGTPDCVNGINISAANGKITVTGLDGAPVSSLQVFSSTWQQVFNCFANCGASQIVTVPAGTYYVFAKYYTAGYSLICEKQATVTVTGGDPCANLGGDSDGDGVCNNNDCQPNNPAFPATPGSPCNDGNPSTSNDVVIANGCGCAGTPTNVCDNIILGGTIGFGTNCGSSIQYCSTAGPVPTIGNCTSPTGGTGNLEIVWLKSTTSCTVPTTTAAQIAAGLDPHWTMISGATGLTYSPGTVTQNTCYLRCARRAGCPVFIESNIISLTIAPNCGGNNNAPNCANIVIAASPGSIAVSGLNGAPVTSVQVFSSAWQTVSSCFGNCTSPVTTIPVTAGTYYVYVKYYTANYQLVCEVQQTVNVTQALAADQSELFQLEAIKHSEHVQLVWKHNGDFKVDEYVLERSLNGTDFEKVYATASDKSTAADVYEGFDLEPQTGVNYYRVRMLNEDGTERLSAVREVVFEDIAEFSLFPNPANGFTNLNLESVVGKQDVDIHIYNNMGLRMKQFHLDEVWGKHYQMDLRDLHEGHYSVWVNVPGKRPIAIQLVIGRI
jgi:uncharacterized repeat protein (TIGR01451 family)